MKCSFCGNEVEKGMKYCPFCGAEVKKETSDNQTSGTENSSDPNGGYSYGQNNSDPNSGYSYGQNSNSSDSNGGYSYGQNSGDPNGGYSYGRNSSDPNGGYNYGGSSNNGYNQYNNGQPEKQISGTPYIIFSILVTLCCCLPLGIVSIVYASKINSLQKSGDYEGAKAAAKKAKIFMIVGAIGGLITSVGLFTTGYFGDSSSVQIVENILDDDTTTTDTQDDVDETDKKEDTKELVTASEDLGDSWNSYTVQINDSVMTFPCDVSKLEEAGLTLDTDDTEEDYVINKGDYELIYFLDTNANSLMFVVTNRTDSAKTVNECTVSGVYVDEYDVEDGSLTVIFPGDVQIGMDISDVEAKWGEPSDTYEGEYSYTYTWYDEDTYNYCSVNVDPGTKKVIAIDLDGQDL